MIATACHLSLVILASGSRPDGGPLRSMLDAFRKELGLLGRSYEVIVVNDGAGDDFQDQLLEIRRTWSEMRIIRFRRSFGESVALSTAVEHARGSYVVVNTWYLQVDPAGLHQAVDLLDEGYDYVAVRRHPRRDGPLARFQSWLFNAYTRWLTRVKVYDLNCSFRAFRREVVEELSFHGDMFRFVSILAVQKGFRVREIPLRHLREEGPSTFLNVGLYLRRLLDILALFFLIKFTKKPLRFFGMVGSVFFALGLAATAWMGYVRIFEGESLADKPLLVLGIFLVVLGIIIASIGLIGEIIIFTQGRQHRDYHIDRIVEGGTRLPAVPAGEPRPPERIQVEALRPSWEGAWQDYVDHHPQGTLFHGLRWRDVLRATLRHEHKYLLARRGEEIVGVLPLVEIRSLLFGHSLISVPFGVYGGVLTEESEAGEALVREARHLRAESGADYVELRHQDAVPGVDLPESDLYHTFLRELPDDPSEVLAMFPRKARAEVRKARRNTELKVDTGILDLDEFYHLFAINKRELGSPIFPRSLFWNLRQILGEDLHVLRVRRNDVTLASVLSFHYRDTLMAYYSGARPEARAVSASNLMYAALMEHAVEMGVKVFDFGRSRKPAPDQPGGAHAFKRNQGFEPRPLHYHYVLGEGDGLPEVNASNPRYDFAKKVFRRMPGWVAERAGSFVVKRMPV